MFSEKVFPKVFGISTKTPDSFFYVLFSVGSVVPQSTTLTVQRLPVFVFVLCQAAIGFPVLRVLANGKGMVTKGWQKALPQGPFIILSQCFLLHNPFQSHIVPSSLLSLV
jgi:hypothetical protein